ASIHPAGGRQSAARKHATVPCDQFYSFIVRSLSAADLKKEREMSDPFVAEIRMFGFNFAPTGWAQCNGQLLPISQNTALFSLLGTFYGGDGKSTFALPNLQGSVPIGQGQGSGLSARFLGEQSGVPFVTLLTSE